MKLIDLYHDYKLNYSDFVIFFEIGNFYEVMGVDATIVHLLTNYKLKNVSKEVQVGFPVASFFKVSNKLEESRVNYIVVKNNEIINKKIYKDNKYYEFENKARYNILVFKKIDLITNKLKEKANKEDITSLLNKISELL